MAGQAPYGTVTVGTSATSVALAVQGSIALFNNGTATVYVGTNNLVTTGTGYPLVAGAQMSITSHNAVLTVFAISGTAGQDIRFLVQAL